MRAVVQRVTSSRVQVAGQDQGKITKGLLVLLGIASTDTKDDSRWLANKIVGLRIFEDDNQKMNLELSEVSGSLLVVSQFTLYGDCQKGKRPNFMQAAAPDVATPLYEEFIAAARELGVPVETGVFGAMMEVHLVNSGPVTLIVESNLAKSG